MTNYVATSTDKIDDPKELVAALSRVLAVALTSDVLDPNAKMYIFGLLAASGFTVKVTPPTGDAND